MRILPCGLLVCSALLGTTFHGANGDEEMFSDELESTERGLDEATHAVPLSVAEAAFLQPPAPVPSLRPLPPRTPSSPEFSLGDFGLGANLLSQDRNERAAGPSSDVIPGLESLLRVSTDAGNLLGKSPASPGLRTERRNPIVTNSRIRGMTTGQQLASGSYWFPARQDLDTALSKIDSCIVQDVIVIKGPYSALYGPGFSFYDLELLDTPRYADGRHVYGSTAADYQTNGQQFHGRQDLWGGSDDWGFRASYNHRTGNDYRTGNGTNIPASYNSREAYGAIGLDPSPDSHLEFSYLRLDQTGVEFPAQAFDMDYLVTDGYELRYVVVNQCWFDRLAVDSWFNETRFAGNSQAVGKRRQIPELDDPLEFLGFTDAHASSAGFRLAATWGQPGDPQLTAGVDLRQLSQQLNEYEFSPWLFTSLDEENYNFPIPPSHATNPGLLVQGVLPLGERLTIRSGSRVDWVSTNAARFVANTNYDMDENKLPDDLEKYLGGTFERDFSLWSLFLTGEYEMSSHWTALAGAGCAMRPPTLTELYAVESFLAVLQQGFTKVLGNPALSPERLWQIDVGLRADYDRLHGGVHAFHAWIQDFITYETYSAFPGLAEPALTVAYLNTDLATLAGAEADVAYDCNEWLTSFGTLSYVEGRDQTRGDRGLPIGSFSPQEPLPGIVPLESRVGLRVHDPNEQPRWAAEFGARIVAEQERVASSLLEQPTPGFTVFDLRGYWQATDSLLLIAGVENLTDKHYREHLDLRTGYGVYQPGRSFYFGTELQY